MNYWYWNSKVRSTCFTKYNIRARYLNFLNCKGNKNLDGCQLSKTRSTNQQWIFYITNYFSALNWNLRLANQCMRGRGGIDWRRSLRTWWFHQQLTLNLATFKSMDSKGNCIIWGTYTQTQKSHCKMSELKKEILKMNCVCLLPEEYLCYYIKTWYISTALRVHHTDSNPIYHES